jgi:hypothetical protein
MEFEGVIVSYPSGVDIGLSCRHATSLGQEMWWEKRIAAWPNGRVPASESPLPPGGECGG